MTKPVAILRFFHDLEDGWYRLDEPDGSKSDWSWPESVKLHCNSNGWDIVFLGDEMYRPESIPAAETRSYKLQ